MIADVPATASTTAVGVAEREYRIAIYRPVVRPGAIKLNVSNLGEDGHDLVVRSPRGRTLKTLGELRPGARGVLSIRLRTTGRYTLVCTLADHERRGMHSVLRVRRAS